jgi:Putative restriction endonuclease
VVTCAPAERGARAIGEPRLIVEVLSPSTAAHDRGVKLADYRKLGTVEQILMVASEDRNLEVWRRAKDGWNVEDLIGDAAIALSIDGQPPPLAAIYGGVALQSKSSAPTRSLEFPVIAGLEPAIHAAASACPADGCPCRARA